MPTLALTMISSNSVDKGVNDAKKDNNDTGFKILKGLSEYYGDTESEKVLMYASKIVCQLSGKRLNFYFEEGVRFRDALLKRIYSECWMPIVIYG